MASGAAGPLTKPCRSESVSTACILPFTPPPLCGAMCSALALLVRAVFITQFSLSPCSSRFSHTSGAQERPFLWGRGEQGHVERTQRSSAPRVPPTCRHDQHGDEFCCRLARRLHAVISDQLLARSTISTKFSGSGNLGAFLPPRSRSSPLALVPPPSLSFLLPLSHST